MLFVAEVFGGGRWNYHVLGGFQRRSDFSIVRRRFLYVYRFNDDPAVFDDREVVHRLAVELGERSFLRVLFHLSVSPPFLAGARRHLFHTRTTDSDSFSSVARLSSDHAGVLFPSTVLRFLGCIAQAESLRPK